MHYEFWALLQCACIEGRSFEHCQSWIQGGSQGATEPGGARASKIGLMVVSILTKRQHCNPGQPGFELKPLSQDLEPLLSNFLDPPLIAAVRTCLERAGFWALLQCACIERAEFWALLQCACLERAGFWALLQCASIERAEFWTLHVRIERAEFWLHILVTLSDLTTRSRSIFDLCMQICDISL